MSVVAGMTGAKLVVVDCLLAFGWALCCPPSRTAKASWCSVRGQRYATEFLSVGEVSSLWPGLGRQSPQCGCSCGLRCWYCLLSAWALPTLERSCARTSRCFLCLTPSEHLPLERSSEYRNTSNFRAELELCWQSLNQRSGLAMPAEKLLLAAYVAATQRASASLAVGTGLAM